jgi:hypothetical protein
LNECGEVKVNKQVLVAFTIGRYSDEVLCNVVPMHPSHILLGRPWQYDRRVIHDGFRNRYNFVKNGKIVKLAPLTLKQNYEDQLKMKSEIEQNRKSEKENREVLENKEKRVEPLEKKEWEFAERKGKTNMSFYAQESGVKRAFLEDQPMSFIVYKESSLNLDETNQSLPSLAVSLLHESEDVFSENMLSGLSPIRGIEHQIDFVPRVVIPNRSAYRSKPDVYPWDRTPFWTHNQIETYSRKPRIKSRESRPVEIPFQEPRIKSGRSI